MRLSFVVRTLIDIDIDAKRNDWISLDLIECPFKDVNLVLVLLVDSATEDILYDAIFELSPDGLVWVIISVMNYDYYLININISLQVPLSQRPPICIDNPGSEAVRRCRVDLTSPGTDICRRHFRVRLLDDKDVKWTVYEMFVLTLNVTGH